VKRASAIENFSCTFHVGSGGYFASLVLDYQRKTSLT